MREEKRESKRERKGETGRERQGEGERGRGRDGPETYQGHSLLHKYLECDKSAKIDRFTGRKRPILMRRDLFFLRDLTYPYYANRTFRRKEYAS